MIKASQPQGGEAIPVKYDTTGFLFTPVADKNNGPKEWSCSLHPSRNDNTVLATMKIPVNYILFKRLHSTR